MLVFFVVLFTAVQQYVNCFMTGDNLWYASQFLSMLETTTALYFLASFIPYKRLFTKTAAGVWCAISATDCLTYPLWFINSPIAGYVHAFQFSASLAVFFYICIKSYTRIESDTVNKGYIYQVRTIPASFQDAVLSALYLHPFGGTGVICGGNWYHYRRGRLECDSIDRIPLNKCVILRTRTELPGDANAINKLVGEKWTWVNNCVTRLYLFSRTGYYSGD